MQYKVPQNVDIEDKVIGPLSLRQFMIILIGVAVIVFFNFIFVGYLRILFWFLAILVGVLTGVLAFAKYGDQTAEIFLFGALKTLSSPRQRIWKKVASAEDEKPAETQVVTQKSARAKPLHEVRDDLSKLANFVDTGGSTGVTEKDRLFAFQAQNTEDKTTPDLLAEAESNNNAVSEYIDAAKTTKREPLISEVASLSPQQNFDYPKIEIKKRNQISNHTENL